MAMAASTAATCSSRTAAPDPGALPASVWARRRLTDQGDQVLLGAVVDVALEATTLGVVGVDEPLPGLLQLVGPCRELVGAAGELGAEPGPVQDQAGLGREAGEQPFLDRPERLVRPARCSRSMPSRSPSSTHVVRPHGRPGRRSSAAASSVTRGLGRPGGRQHSARRRPRARPAPTARRCPRRAAAPSASAGHRVRAPGRPARVGDTDSVKLLSTSYGELASVVEPSLGDALAASAWTGSKPEGDDRRREHRQPDVRRVGAARSAPHRRARRRRRRRRRRAACPGARRRGTRRSRSQRRGARHGSSLLCRGKPAAGEPSGRVGETALAGRSVSGQRVAST